ncbi:MAG: DUF6057 family protein [Bacteroides sp.]|nr:DUF6057 family protein [Roseburia sp.]MCM1346408.1 DUF6057 family protein [Bacteroides sp.]MCM1420949.1 DUF6057 family protein [Bacteroides sp.]
MKRIVYPALFAAFAISLLLFELSDYLYETAGMTPFYTTDVFVHDMTGCCGGMLAFVSSFLQSCFAIPWIGALCLTVVLMSIPYILKQLSSIDSRLEPLCWLPSFAMLLNYTQLGYMIYTLKSPAVAFTLPLGVFMALMLVWLFRLICQKEGLPGLIFKVVWIAAVSTLGYYALGCYALYALLLAVPFLWEKSQASAAHHVSFSVICTLLLLVSFLVPYIFYQSGILPLRLEAAYQVGLPDYRWTAAERSLWMPLVFSLCWILFLLILSLCAHPEKRTEAKKSRLLSAFLFVFFVGAGYLTYYNTFRDTNYRQILKMKHAADKSDWTEVLNIARSADSSSDNYIPPTRLQVLFTRLALSELRRAADEMFSYPEGDTPYNALRTSRYLRLIGGRTLYYYYGKLNYSYRWCMEDMVEYGMRPDYLKYMLRYAVINGEWQLAQKYANTLRTNPFCRDFVARYYDSPTDSVKKEFGEVVKLLNYENILDGDGGLIEVYLLNSYAMMEGGTQEMVNLSLLSCLILKNIDGFWQRFFALLPTFPDGRIPRHYQEAVLLFDKLKPGVDISRLPIDEEVRKRFERLVEASANNSQFGDEYNRSVLRASYGDTYWYYYFFMTELKTN